MSVRQESVGDECDIVRNFVSLDELLVEGIQNVDVVILCHIGKVRPIEPKGVVCLLHNCCYGMVPLGCLSSFVKLDCVNV